MNAVIVNVRHTLRRAKATCWQNVFYCQFPDEWRIDLDVCNESYRQQMLYFPAAHPAVRMHHILTHQFLSNVMWPAHAQKVIRSKMSVPDQSDIWPWLRFKVFFVTRYVYCSSYLAHFLIRNCMIRYRYSSRSCSPYCNWSDRLSLKSLMLRHFMSDRNEIWHDYSASKYASTDWI